MKKILSIFVAILIYISAAAQIDNSIIINQNSFRSVQRDVLTGVNIDPISVDSSRRPCARIKVKIERMTREEINGIGVVIATNNQLVKCKSSEYENGLIIEMTAKEATRFYFRHQEYGDSNEVTLNLEPNKEYYIEASLNQTFSIVVNSNVVDANVYIDNIYRGVTDSHYSLTVRDIMVGEHTLKVEYGGMKYEQTIVVNKDSISFRQFINTAASQAQYVVIEVAPQNAVVEIDNKFYTPQDGIVTLVLGNGTYQYNISAVDYHNQRGSITVSGAKVEKSISLLPAFGWLEIGGGALSGANVVVDGNLIGVAPIKSGNLSSGEHVVQIVKEFYKAHTGTVTIRDNQVTSYNPTLVSDFATVTLVAPDSQIWVNGKRVGDNSWTGPLATGTYLFESRREGCRSNSISQTIAAQPSTQSYNLPAPTPIVGSVDIQSTPAMADVAIDGKSVGRTPIMVNNLLIGTHSITISKSGYATKNLSIVIEENKTNSINTTLSKSSATQTAQSGMTTVNSSTSSGIYKVGDYYNDGVKEGVVFEVSADGRSGKIVSMTHSDDDRMPWAVGAEQKKKIGATNSTDGRKNMEVVQRISGWQNLYPGFAWCAKLGKDWYLPAIDELKVFTLNQSVYDAVNKTLQKHNGTPLLRRGGEYSGGAWYWSSTENGVWDKTLKQYEAYHVALKTIKQFAGYKSYPYRNVRAIARFGDGDASTVSHTPSTPISGIYKVGDIYDDGVKRGVIFDINGSTAKIVSLKRSQNMVIWAVSSEAGRNIGAVSTTDGEENFNLVKKIANWRNSYPAFAWCASLGEGWYLPAKGELETLQKNKHLVEPRMTDRLNETFFFSSTESRSEVGGMKCVYDVGMKSGSNLKSKKNNHSYAIAVAKVKINNSSSSSTAYMQPSSKVYRVGDLYNENGKKGVVFKVDATGRHGKIISIECSPSLAWAVGDEQRRFIGATDKYDGEKNLDVIKRISGWQSKYPVFYWCANLGDGWYLPSKEEWTEINRVRRYIEPNLSRKLDTYFWTSTEENEVYKDQYCAWNINSGDHSSYCKDRTNNVFAVAKF